MARCSVHFSVIFLRFSEYPSILRLHRWVDPESSQRIFTQKQKANGAHDVFVRKLSEETSSEETVDSLPKVL